MSGPAHFTQHRHGSNRCVTLEWPYTQGDGNVAALQAQLQERDVQLRAAEQAVAAATQAAGAAQRERTLSHKQHVDELQQELQHARLELADRDKQLQMASSAQGRPALGYANGSAQMVWEYARFRHQPARQPQVQRLARVGRLCLLRLAKS